MYHIDPSYLKLTFFKDGASTFVACFAALHTQRNFKLDF
jgi:hypothetical protein